MPPAAPARHHIVIPNRPAPVPVVLNVSPQCADAGDGSSAHPFATLVRAQTAVRGLNRTSDVTVRIAAGIYRQAAPLRFTADDGGQNGFTVRWEGAPGAYPVLSGGVPVTGWQIADRTKDLWYAVVPQGADPRQLSVNGRLAARASVEMPSSAAEFQPWGLAIKDPAWRIPAQLPDQRRIEVEG